MAKIAAHLSPLDTRSASKSSLAHTYRIQKVCEWPACEYGEHLLPFGKRATHG